MVNLLFSNNRVIALIDKISTKEVIKWCYFVLVPNRWLREIIKRGISSKIGARVKIPLNKYFLIQKLFFQINKIINITYKKL